MGTKTHRLAGERPRPNIRAIYSAISISLTLILVYIWGLYWFVSPSTLALPISLVIALALVPNVAVARWAEPVPTPLVGISLGANIFAITAGIHYGGGVDQVSAPLLYTIIIGLAGLLISGRAAFIAAATSVCAYTVLVWAEYATILPHMVSYSRPPDRQAATALTLSVYLFLFAWLVSYTARQVRLSYQRAEELRREAVSALSHDIKNPLAVIAGYADMLRDADPGEHDDLIRRIQHSTQQATHLVANVLDAAAFEGRPMVANYAPMRLNEVIDQVCEQYQIPAEAKGLHISLRRAVDEPVIEADAQLISRALGNLVSNAIKYTPQQGQIEVASASTGDGVEISVADNGKGIPSEALARLFQPYSRVGTDRGIEGTGLGLYIVRRIAEAHGGSATVRSTVGAGTTFTLHLPKTP